MRPGRADLIEDEVFGRFRLDAGENSLWCDGKRLPLRARSVDILRILIAADGGLVTKDALMDRVWRGAIVDENVLQVHVSALRKALGESAGSQSHIVTVPGRGYCFIREPAIPLATAASATLPQGLERPSIAVLRFQNMSDDPGQDYFADGVVEDIITALTRNSRLSVVARNSSFAIGRHAVDVREIGRRLNARYVLEGSVRKSGRRLRMNAQLIQAGDGMHVWAAGFDGDIGDVFAFQDELTARVVGALLPTLRMAEIERARRKPPESLDAYDLYLRAFAARHTLTREGNDEALRLIGQAMTLDPTFADAAVFAGAIWGGRVINGWTTDGSAQREALRCMRLAVLLDPNGAEAIASLARMISGFEDDCEEVRRLARRAIALSPGSPIILRITGFALVHIGEYRNGYEYLRRALQFAPNDFMSFDCWTGVALALIGLERDEEATEAARTAVQQSPRFAMALRALASSLALLGRSDEARDAVRRVVEIDPTCSMQAMRTRFGGAYQRGSVRYLSGLRLAGLPEA
jgi:TolB-like protein/tetratricopeptide (TPR) repeat protein